MYYLANFEWKPLSQLALAKGLGDKEFKERYEAKEGFRRRKSRAEQRRITENDPDRYKSKKYSNRKKVRESQNFIDSALYNDLDDFAKNPQNTITGKNAIRQIKGKGVKVKLGRKNAVKRLNQSSLVTPSQQRPEVQKIITRNTNLIIPEKKASKVPELILPPPKRKKKVVTVESSNQTVPDAKRYQGQVPFKRKPKPKRAVPNEKAYQGIKPFNRRANTWQLEDIRIDDTIGDSFDRVETPNPKTKVSSKLGRNLIYGLGGTALLGAGLYGVNRLRKSRSDKGKKRGKYN